VQQAKNRSMEGGGEPGILVTAPENLFLGRSLGS
jgi:hypothetical protein